MTLLLTIDTSIRGVSASLAKPGDAMQTPLWESAHLDVMSSASQIAALVERGLDHVRQPATAVTGIAISTGPGSFTGIKIGIAFAAGFTLGRRQECRLLGASSLEHGLREMRSESEDWQAVFLPATRTHGFVSFCNGSEIQTRLVDFSADSRDHAWIGELAGKQAVIGEWPVLETNEHWHGDKLDHARGAGFALRGLRRWAQSQWPSGFGGDVPTPQYMRLTTAEEKLEQMGKKE